MEFVEIPAIGNERHDAVFRQPIGCPTDEPLVHIVLLRLLRRAVGDIGLADALIDLRILSIGIELVPIALIRVIRRIPHDHADRLLVLFLNPLQIVHRQPAQI